MIIVLPLEIVLVSFHYIPKLGYSLRSRNFMNAPVLTQFENACRKRPGQFSVFGMPNIVESSVFGTLPVQIKPIIPAGVNTGSS